MNELPRGWAAATLGHVVAPDTGTVAAAGSGLPYLGLDGVESSSTRILDYSDSQAIRGPAKPFAPGYTLYARLRPYLNKVAAPDSAGVASTEFIVFPPSEVLAPRFLLYLLNTPSFVEFANQNAEGIERPRLSWQRMSKFVFGLPPLAEQQRIVAAVEEQLSRLDAADHLLRTVASRLGAVIRALLARIDTAGWPALRIADLAELVTDGDHNPPPRFGSGIPHLTAKNIREGAIQLDGCTFVSRKGFEQTRKRYEPRPDDVIVTCVGTIGECAVVPTGLIFSADRNLAAIRLLPEYDSRYVRLALTTPRQRRIMAAASGSTAQPHLYLRELRALEIPMPPLDYQRKLAAEIEEHEARVALIRRAAANARQRCVQLRRSVLNAAFRGELVPQDPNDEPASALLEQIAAELAAAPKTTRKRRERTPA